MHAHLPSGTIPISLLEFKKYQTMNIGYSQDINSAAHAICVNNKEIKTVKKCDDRSLPGLTGKRTELNFLANGSKRQSGELTLSTNSATGGKKSVTNFWIPGICGNWTSDKPRETSQDLLSLVFNVSTM